jgi:hypothetical protein
LQHHVSVWSSLFHFFTLLRLPALAPRALALRVSAERCARGMMLGAR